MKFNLREYAVYFDPENGIYRLVSGARLASSVPKYPEQETIIDNIKSDYGLL